MVHNRPTDVSITEAKARLPELVRRAEAGDELVLTRRGKPAARLLPTRKTPEDLRAAIREIQASAAAKARPGPSAARSQDFLYDGETGLPG
jgi:prevent-host-death family protein